MTHLICGTVSRACTGSNKRAGGWWVVNKANGHFKYVPADGLDLTKEIDKLSSNLDVIESNEFKRCFEPVEETFRGKPTGNKVLTKTCSFVDTSKLLVNLAGDTLTGIAGKRAKDCFIR